MYFHFILINQLSQLLFVLDLLLVCIVYEARGTRTPNIRVWNPTRYCHMIFKRGSSGKSDLSVICCGLTRALFNKALQFLKQLDNTIPNQFAISIKSISIQYQISIKSIPNQHQITNNSVSNQCQINTKSIRN